MSELAGAVDTKVDTQIALKGPGNLAGRVVQVIWHPERCVNELGTDFPTTKAEYWHGVRDW